MRVSERQWGAVSKATDSLWSAIAAGDMDGIERALLAGADCNAVNGIDETPLIDAIQHEDAACRLSMVVCLLEAGADPNYQGVEGCGVLFEAVLSKDAAVMEALLRAGGNPNYQVEPSISLYDWAEFDYRHDTFDLALPIDPTDEERCDQSRWLAYLERCADMVGVERPDYLRVMRRYGAKGFREIAKRGGSL